MNGPAARPGGRWYLASIAAFMMPAGIQTVLVPYLLAIELHQPAQHFGLMQMLGQLPLLLFLLPGGWLADRVDARRVLMVLQALAILMPLLLAWMLWQGHLNAPLVLAYAVTWGLVSAFAMPARDGLLRRVAGSDVQRMVSMAIGVQFASQMLGQALGGTAARLGAIGILLCQVGVLLLGVVIATRLPARAAPAASPAAAHKAGGLTALLGGGLTQIFKDATMRGTFLLTIGMGIFFGGVFVVYVPLAIRDLYAGSAQDIATGFLVFGVGTLISIVTLMQRGGARRPGRALLWSQLSGCLALLPITLAPPQALFYLCVFIWGMSGGVAVTMSRTILQEHSPASHQSQVMAALSLSTVGGSPIGSALIGFAVSAMTVRWAVLVPILGVGLITLAAMLTHHLAAIASKSHRP